MYEATWKSHPKVSGAKAMRKVFIEKARQHPSRDPNGPQSTLLKLALALTRLEEIAERQAGIVDVRVFAGLDEKEISQIFEVSERTVKREYAIARARLQQAMNGDDDPDASVTLNT